MILRDPQTGIGQGVNIEGYGNSNAVIHTIGRHANIVHKEAYAAVISVTPTGAGDCFFYAKNNNNDNLIITSMKLYSASAESVQIKLGDAGTVGGTHAALTPVSKFAGSGGVADATCESGVDITDLSGGSIVDLLYCTNEMKRWQWQSGLVVPKNSIFSLYAVTGAVAINATVCFYFCGMCE